MENLPETLINPSWVQAGEIGALFVTILALIIFVSKVLSIVRDLLEGAKQREEKVMGFVFGIQPTLSDILSTQKLIVATLQIHSEIFEDVKDVLKIDRRKKRGNGWSKDD